ncbi:MAG: hypothetical protein M3Y53_04965, partial [Thermoproteota archaeon]|nr:hypothetical protein [Thermoproteota archaeon]
ECYMGLNEASSSLRKNCTISAYNMDALLNSFRRARRLNRNKSEVYATVFFLGKRKSVRRIDL